MFRKKLTVGFPEGLHVGPGYELSRRARRYPCRVELRTAKGTFDAKNGLQVLRAGVGPGGELELVCEGEREAEAGEALYAFLANTSDWSKTN